ncbi:unnamed protein product [Lupinus luteus]|uniref:Uncharacterized protein n=1 Tax=Lupinus luteus TaxID=3873 RepID=A0AAV1VRL2_LUPLU
MQGYPFSLSTTSSIGGFSPEQNTNPNPKPNQPPLPKKKRNLPGTPEESARLTSVTTSTNLNFKNEESSMMNSHQGLAHGLIGGEGSLHQNVAGIPQFVPHDFQLHFNGMGMGEDQQRPSLSLWLNQGNHHHQMNNTNNNNNNPSDMGQNSGLYASSGLPEIMQMAHANNNALIGSNSSMMSNYGVPVSNSTTANLSLSSLPIGKRVESSGNSDLASIYSDGQNKQTNKPASPMSATALLQKAAQMGSIRSNTNPSIFNGSFGVMTSSSSQQENFASTSSAVAMLGNAANYSSLSHSSNSFDQLMMQTNQSEPMKLKILSGTSSAEHNLTRDFLGVSGGGGGPGPQFLPQELAKFASLGSPMGLTQFTGHH